MSGNIASEELRKRIEDPMAGQLSSDKKAKQPVLGSAAEVQSLLAQIKEVERLKKQQKRKRKRKKTSKKHKRKKKRRRASSSGSSSSGSRGDKRGTNDDGKMSDSTDNPRVTFRTSLGA
jgi:hypothetical protein